VLKISVIESRSERRLILEGKLLAPQVTELRTASEKGQSGRSKPRDRADDLTAISQEGEGMLLGLMSCHFHLRIWTAPNCK
jgi:hypothetical protein